MRDMVGLPWGWNRRGKYAYGGERKGQGKAASQEVELGGRAQNDRLTL
jgi:hypothetical protein